MWIQGGYLPHRFDGVRHADCCRRVGRSGKRPARCRDAGSFVSARRSTAASSSAGVEPQSGVSLAPGGSIGLGLNAAGRYGLEPASPRQCALQAPADAPFDRATCHPAGALRANVMDAAARTLDVSELVGTNGERPGRQGSPRQRVAGHPGFRPSHCWAPRERPRAPPRPSQRRGRRGASRWSGATSAADRRSPRVLSSLG
jgi:hypothetical protein